MESPSGEGPRIAEVQAYVSTTPPPVSGTWNDTGGGSWATAGKWNPNGVPGNGGNATFGSAITSNAAVTLDGDRLISGLTFDNAKRYTISQGGSGTLTLSIGSGAVPATVTSGSHEISAPILLGSDLAVTVDNLAGTFTLSGTLSGSYGVTKSGPGKLVLSGTGTNFGGALTLSDGTFAVDGSGTYSGQFAGSAPLVKEGGGTNHQRDLTELRDRLQAAVRVSNERRGGSAGAWKVGQVDFSGNTW
jgi:autotransporter-associated beta strand protein